MALRVIAGDIRAYPYQGDIQAYWNDYGDEIEQLDQCKSQNSPPAHHLSLSYYSPNLAELVERRVQRSIENLKAQHELAYRLLCMGSIFRGSIERTAWLIQIGEASKREQLDAFQALQRRFLLEEDLLNGRIRYRLHSLIRSVALEHLDQMTAQVQ